MNAWKLREGTVIGWEFDWKFDWKFGWKSGWKYDDSWELKDCEFRNWEIYDLIIWDSIAR